MADRSNWPTKVIKQGEAPPASEARKRTPAERFLMVWEITRDAFGLAGYDVDRPMRRDLVKIKRPSLLKVLVLRLKAFFTAR